MLPETRRDAFEFAEPSTNAPQSSPAPPTGTASRTADNTPEPGTGTTSGKLLPADLPLGTAPRP
ncbi:hypothetical protein ACFVTF_10595 [Kitasatospora sp. NPDC057940]|uniref:hypothetical protein n=1 Tax=Kitasatospora sp. NPDC057940 TaxID=3346285 RepID=UPI0036D83AE4